MIPQSQLDELKKKGERCKHLLWIDGGNVGETILSLIDELEQFRRDAERYQWLRNIGDEDWTPFCEKDGTNGRMTDQAIDAAIAEQENK